MKTINITVNKANVFDEVAKTTAYVGAKLMDSDATAYDRIASTDEDRQLLERFWRECCNVVTDQLKWLVTEVNEQPISHGIDLENNYDITLNMPDAYNDKLDNNVATGLFSFFVQAICAKWFAVANKPEAEAYTISAANTLNTAIRALYHRTPPQKNT